MKIALVKSKNAPVNKTFISCIKGIEKTDNLSKLIELRDDLNILSEYDACVIQGTWDETNKSQKKDRVFSELPSA